MAGRSLPFCRCVYSCQYYYVLYNQAYFVDFCGYKTAKIGPLKISRYTVVCVWMFTYNAGTCENSDPHKYLHH